MNTGDNAWVLASAALVLMMTPALAMFYGGLSRSKNVLTTMMQSFFLMGLASLVWMFWGFSLSFSTDAAWGILGGGKFLALYGISGDWPNSTISAATFVIFQCGFAVLTPALITGAFAERMTFVSYVLFMILWITLVYCPVCHWVWGPGGWLAKMGTLDFAGGTVVHINSGMAALACCLFIGPRKGYPTTPMRPHNLPLTLTGAGLLWIGWFGFNAGSALNAGHGAAMAFLVTHLATAAACVSWLIVEWRVMGTTTTLGVASGAIAGLVAITPAAGFVSPLCAVIIGAAAGALCYFAVLAKNYLKYDDSFDVVGIHGVGGAWGAIATGLFAAKEFGGTDGFFFGNSSQLISQAVAVFATSTYSFVVTLIILVGVDLLAPVKVNEEEEDEGCDSTLHGEAGYHL